MALRGTQATTLQDARQPPQPPQLTPAEQVQEELDDHLSTVEEIPSFLPSHLPTWWHERQQGTRWVSCCQVSAGLFACKSRSGGLENGIGGTGEMTGSRRHNHGGRMVEAVMMVKLNRDLVSHNPESVVMQNCLEGHDPQKT